jgi:hypothetical protein
MWLEAYHARLSYEFICSFVLMALSIEALSSLADEAVVRAEKLHQLGPRNGVSSTIMVGMAVDSHSTPSKTAVLGERLIPYVDWWKGRDFIRTRVVVPLSHGVLDESHRDRRNYCFCSTKVITKSSTVTLYRTVDFFSKMEELVFTPDFVLNASLVGVDLVPADRIAAVVQQNIKQTSTPNLTSEEVNCAMAAAQRVALLIKTNREMRDHASMAVVDSLKDGGGTQKYLLVLGTIGLMFPLLMLGFMTASDLLSDLSWAVSLFCIQCRSALALL